MTNSLIAPGLLLLLGAVLVPFLGRLGRQVVALVLPLAALAICLVADEGAVLRSRFLDFAIVWVDVQMLGRLFAIVFCIMAFAGALFAAGRVSRLEMAAALFYAGGAVGAVLSGDLIAFLVFWEMMAIGSTILVWCGGTAASLRAGLRYAGVHVTGGVILMIGIIGHVAATGSPAFTQLTLDGWPSWLMLTGILVNAAAFPLSAWVPDAYPESSPSGMVFLSAFTTKTAVFALLRLFPGTELLIPVGLVMVLYGVVYALRENDVRRILAYSIVGQVGMMVAGVGIGTAMALNGAAAHAFAHVLYKGLLVMSAGAVMTMTGRREATELGGLWRTMPVTMLCCVVGTLSIAAFPLTSGFVTKSMIAEAAADESLQAVWLLLTAASVGTLVYLSVPWFLFFQRDSGLRPPDAPATMQAAMLLLAALSIGIGVFPGVLYGLLPYGVEYVPYTADHVVAQIQIVGGCVLMFFLARRFLERRHARLLDADWFYRVAGPRAAFWLYRSIAWGAGQAQAAGLQAVSRTVAWLAVHCAPTGRWGRTVPVNQAAIWVVVLLLAFLVAEFV